MKQKPSHSILSLLFLTLLLLSCKSSESLPPTSTSAPHQTPTIATASSLTPGILPTTGKTPLPSPTATSPPLPVYAQVLEEGIVLTASNLAFLERLGELWKMHVSDVAFYPGQASIILGTGNRLSTSNEHFGGVSEQTKLILWDLQTNTGRPILETGDADDHFNSVAISPDGKWLAFIGIDHVILGTGEISDPSHFSQQTIPLSSPMFRAVDQGAIFSPDSHLLALVNANGELLVWDVQTNTWVATFLMASEGPDGIPVPTCSYGALGVFFMPDGKSILSSCTSDLLFSSLETLTQTSLPLFSRSTSAFALSPDGRVLVTGSYDGMLRIWAFPSGELYAELPGHTGAVRTLAFHPDGNLLASSDETLAFLWDIKAQTYLTALDGPMDILVFSPDGKFLVAGTYDQGGTLWGVRPASLKVQRTGVKLVLSEGAVPLQAWGALVPETWLPPEGTFPHYELRLSSAWEGIQSCNYGEIGNLHTLTLRQAVVTVTVTDLETNTLLVEHRFEGEAPGTCPESWAFSPLEFSDFLEGGAPDLTPFEPWLRETMAALGFN